MRISVYDTYVRRKDGRTMHFDILVPEEITDEPTIFSYGRDYLATKGEAGQELTANECRFCHIENAAPDIRGAIESNGFFIIEMENCD